MKVKGRHPNSVKNQALAKKYKKDQEALDGELIDEDTIDFEDAPDSKDKWTEDDKDLWQYLTPRQRKFCEYYSSHEEVLWNGVRSYAKAYDIDEVKLVSKYKAVQTCSTRLLSNVIVNRYIASLLDLKYSDEFLDSQLWLLALQNADPKIKIEAIKELNKLKQRITDKSEVLNKFDWPIVQIIRSEGTPSKQAEKDIETDDENGI